MTKIFTTDAFDNWFASLRDKRAARYIQVRIDRLEDEHFGDYKFVGLGVFEMRIHHGPGYRVYFALRELDVIILLAGGNKSSQPRDIQLAQKLAHQLKE